MKYVSVHEAKTHLSRLMKRVQKGETITITRRGKVVAALYPYEEPKKSAKKPAKKVVKKK